MSMVKDSEFLEACLWFPVLHIREFQVPQVHWAGKPPQSHQHRQLLLWSEQSWAGVGSLWGYHRAQETCKALHTGLFLGLWWGCDLRAALLIIFSYLSVNKTTPVLFSCWDNTSSLQAAVFQGKKSYWEGKILLGVPDVWGCSKYSCRISMGIKAVMISVTCCGQTPSLYPGSHWHRNPNDLFLWCFLIPDDLDNLVLQDTYVYHAGGQAAHILFYSPWDWEIYNVIWTTLSDYCAVITFHFIWN